MLENDAFDWSRGHGGLTRANGDHFRELVLSRGHSQDYDTIFGSFYGKDPDISPMLRDRGPAAADERGVTPMTLFGQSRSAPPAERASIHKRLAFHVRCERVRPIGMPA